MIILLNPPYLFKTMLSALEYVIDKRTMAKLIPVCGSTDEVCRELAQRFAFAPSTVEWVKNTLNTPLDVALDPPDDASHLHLPGLKKEEHPSDTV